MRPFSIYIHIPFCLQRCPYCDFNSYALTTIPEKDYTSALLSELDYRAAEAEWAGREVQSIYFGGGTPSLFKASSIRHVLTNISGRFAVGKDAEITIEANPGTVDAESLHGYRNAGINRISLGAQSFNSELLRQLGRIHSAEQTEAAVAAVKDAGFSNFNLDLIYAVPGQSLDDLKEDLKRLIRLDPKHVSAYGLTIEKGTPYHSRFRKGLIKLPPESEVLEMMTEVNGFLPSCGYKQYEISNYAERSFEARHNLGYWNGCDYLGLGAGAHSFIAKYEGSRRASGLRWANCTLPKKYIKQTTAKGHAEVSRDVLARDGLIFEFFFLGLRKTAGVSFSEFKSLFGTSIEELHGATVHILVEEGLLQMDGDRLCLSNRGLQLADSVIESFIDQNPASIKEAV